MHQHPTAQDQPLPDVDADIIGPAHFCPPLTAALTASPCGDWPARDPMPQADDDAC